MKRRLPLLTLFVVCFLAILVRYTRSGYESSFDSRNNQRVVLFDGVCVMCNGFINFIMLNVAQTEITCFDIHDDDIEDLQFDSLFLGSSAGEEGEAGAAAHARPSSSSSSLLARRPPFLFSPLQSEKTKRFLARIDETLYEQVLEWNTMLLVEHDKARNATRIFTHSTAAMRALGALSFPYYLLHDLFIHIPTRLRDIVYHQISAHRLSFFGELEYCRLPTDEDRKWFL